MNKWFVYFQLKSSNVDIRAVYIGPENDPGDVFNRMFGNASEDTFISLQDNKGTANILVRAGEVAAMRIARCEEEEEDE